MQHKFYLLDNVLIIRKRFSSSFSFFSGIYWRAISYFQEFLLPARKEIRNNLFYKIRERARQIILTMGMFFSRKNVFMMKSNCGSNWTCLPAIHSGSISFLSRTQLASLAKTPSHILCNVLGIAYSHIALALAAIVALSDLFTLNMTWCFTWSKNQHETSISTFLISVNGLVNHSFNFELAINCTKYVLCSVCRAFFQAKSFFQPRHCKAAKQEKKVSVPHKFKKIFIHRTLSQNERFKCMANKSVWVWLSIKFSKLLLPQVSCVCRHQEVGNSVGKNKTTFKCEFSSKRNSMEYFLARCNVGWVSRDKNIFIIKLKKLINLFD